MLSTNDEDVFKDLLTSVINLQLGTAGEDPEKKFSSDEELSEKLSLSDSRIGDLRAAINFLSPVVGESADKADADADKADETAAGEDE